MSLHRYSPEAATRLRRHRFRAIRFALLWFSSLAGLTAYFVIAMVHDDGFVGLASLTGALFLYSLLPAFGRFRDLFITPPILHPYFSDQVPGYSLASGVDLMREARALDQLAETHGCKRISEFISDDDFFDTSGPTWHDANDGLATFNALLTQFADHSCVQSAYSDLEAIRDRLVYAQANGIRFCLLLRDVHITNGMEWEQRQGKC